MRGVPRNPHLTLVPKDPDLSPSISAPPTFDGVLCNEGAEIPYRPRGPRHSAFVLLRQAPTDPDTNGRKR